MTTVDLKVLDWLARVKPGDEVAVSDTRRVIKLAKVEDRTAGTVRVSGADYWAHNGLITTSKPNTREATRVSIPRILPADAPEAQRRLTAQAHDEAAQQVRTLATQFHKSQDVDDWHALNIAVQRWLKLAK